MRSVFFDLETSDKNPIGQILNYSFILVDEDFTIIDELSGIVQISRLQLPAPDAILANRIDVIEHQRVALDTERQAMAKIHDFIVSAIASQGDAGRLPIVGYNSARFDIPYLRTSFIRNGINPYFGGKIIIRDLLFASRKLAATEPTFPRNPPLNKSKDQSRVSYSLENLTQQFGLLSGEQSHESRADVLLTIELAKCFKHRFGLDVRSFDPFEAFLDQQKPQKGLIRWAWQLEYDPLSKSAAVPRPMVLLDFDHRSSLWIDVARFRSKPDRSSISWFSHTGGHQFIGAPIEALSPEEKTSVDQALAALAGITLKNFFEVSSCDIEQDIYRLDFVAIEQLTKAIWQGEGDKIKTSKNRDLQVVFLRYQLASVAKDTALPANIEKGLRAYGEYRYGGKAQLSKQRPDDAWEEERKREAFHATIDEYLRRIAELSGEGCDESSRALLQSLEAFYRQSDLWRLIKAETQAAANL